MKPMLFNGDMVRALLEGRKTVTRRVVKPQPIWDSCDMRWSWGNVGWWRDGWDPLETITLNNTPYRPGDILYVRETLKIDFLSNIPGSGRIRYKADDTYGDFTFAPERYEMMRRAQLKSGWRPNENMPREAARIFLRVTDVRVERLQDITEEQAEREGCEAYMEEFEENGYWEPATLDFIDTWNSTIKPADRALYGWEANPYVWRIEFKRCERPKEAE